MKHFIFALIMGLIAFTCSAQNSIEVELTFAPSSYTLEAWQVAAVQDLVAQGYRIETVTGYADSLPNRNGMSNETLSFERALAVHTVAGSEGAILDGVVGTSRKVVITASLPNALPIAVLQHETNAAPIEQGSVIATVDVPYVGKVTIPTGLVHETPTVTATPTVTDSLARAEYLAGLSQYERDCQVNVSPTAVESVRHNNIFAIRREFHVLGDKYHAVLTSSHVRGSYDEVTTLRDSIDMTRKGLVKKGNYAYRMWQQYDAKRSWEERRPGAVLDNGSGYHNQPQWGFGARKLRNEVINKHGREIPFLGWDEQEYKEYYRNHSVFPQGEDNNGKATAKQMSYKGYRETLTFKTWFKAVGRKITKFFRGIGSCRKV